MPKRRYWAMRTSRNTEDNRSFIREELFSRSLLRQGWGYAESQNLRAIAKLWVESAWETTSEDQRKDLAQLENVARRSSRASPT
jgi:hypothetical protein